jgi:hypothetical protein
MLATIGTPCSNGSVARIRMPSETPEKREALTTTKVTKYSGIW